MKSLLLPLALLTISLGFSDAAKAQGASCEDIWFERNQLYARAGYCFRTERAISVFGPGCFPPFGRLSAMDQARVSELAILERRSGCLP